jgi:hypothetical protein
MHQIRPHAPENADERPHRASIGGRRHGPSQRQLDVGTVRRERPGTCRPAGDQVVAGAQQFAAQVSDMTPNASVNGLMEQQHPGHVQRALSRDRRRLLAPRIALTGGMRSTGS